jgi:hypothetical protein
MRFMKLLLLIVVCVVTLFAFSTSVHSKRVELSVPVSMLRSGDIIFRDGRGAISSVFRKCSVTDQSYSHAGIIHFENGIPYVFHLIGGEGKASYMRKDLLSSFCSPDESCAVGIYRTDLNADQIDSLTCKFYKQKVQFDIQFDLSTNDKMYCTEMVYKVLTQISGDDNFIPLTTVNKITYCACDNLFLSPHFKKIYSSR